MKLIPAWVGAIGVGGCLVMVLSAVGCGDHKQAENPQLIEPRIRVGKVKSGMTVDQIVAALGEPDQRKKSVLDYRRLGFAIVLDREGVVMTVQCGDIGKSNDPRVKAFHGRTREGIGMGSSRADLVKNFGQPSRTANSGGHETLDYPAPGLLFTLENGAVHALWVRLKAD